MNVKEDDSNEGIDYHNFKGVHYAEQSEKFMDPDNGAHFEFDEACKRLTFAQETNSTFVRKDDPYSSTTSLFDEDDA
jgi:hypothetical protein